MKGRRTKMRKDGQRGGENVKDVERMIGREVGKRTNQGITIQRGERVREG